MSLLRPHRTFGFLSKWRRGRGPENRYPDFECAGLEELVAPEVESYGVDVQCKPVEIQARGLGQFSRLPRPAN
jgi:hypothetical protein